MAHLRTLQYQEFWENVRKGLGGLAGVGVVAPRRVSGVEVRFGAIIWPI